MNKEDLNKAKDLNCQIVALSGILKNLEKQTIDGMAYFFQDYTIKDQLITEVMFNRFKDELITNATAELNKAKAEFEAM